MFKNIDTLNGQIIISLLLGIVLGIMYQRVSPKTIVITANDNSVIQDLENKSFKDSDKCYRYKKVETSCK